MAHPALERLGLVPARRLAATGAVAEPWSVRSLAGCLVELSGRGPASGFTPAFALVWDAQRRGEPAAWVTAGPGTFFPPDAAGCGVDLAALTVVRAPGRRRALRVGDILARSGGFGLVVLDLGRTAVPPADQARLAGLADRHRVAVVCLTRKDAHAPSLGPRVSVRAEATWEPAGAGRFRYRIRAVKDRRQPAGWARSEICRGPDGLR